MPNAFTGLKVKVKVVVKFGAVLIWFVPPRLRAVCFLLDTDLWCAFGYHSVLVSGDSQAYIAE